MMMNKTVLAAVLLAAASFGTYGMVDAATGIVNVNAVLQGSADFQKAGKELVGEQQKLQNQYNNKSKTMTNEQKAELAKELNQKLAQKEKI